MRGRARDAPAFLVERRAFALRGLGGRGGLRRDGGKRLAEFVVQLACKMAPLLVLHLDQLSRQGVAFGEGILQPFCKGVEDAGDDRQFREIETGQACGKIVRRQLPQSSANGPRRPQRARQRGIDRNAKPRQRERHDGEQPARLAPALADLGSGVEGGDRQAPCAARHENRHRDRLTRTKDGAVERRKDFGRGHFVGGRSAADALPKRAGVVAVGNAEARLHQRRDALQIRRCVDGHGEPLRLRLLQRKIPGHDLGDAARFGLRDTVAVKQGVGRDGDKANGSERGDA